MSPYRYAGSQEVNGALQDVNESEYCHMVIYGSQLWLWVQKLHPPAAQILCLRGAANQRKVA